MQLVWEDESGAERAVAFDATVREVHQGGATVTEHPVERGVDVADHVRPAVDRLSVEAMVTNAPLETPGSQTDGATGAVEGVELDLPGRAGFGAQLAKGGASAQAAERIEEAQGQGVNVLRFSQPFDRPRAVYDELRRLKDAGQLLSVVTGLREYDSMVIVAMSAPREEAREAISFTLDLVQVRLAESQIVDAPLPRELRGQPESNRGSQPAEEASQATEERTSLLYSILEAGGVL